MSISYEWNFGEDKELAEKLKQLVLSGKRLQRQVFIKKGKKFQM